MDKLNKLNLNNDCEPSGVCSSCGPNPSSTILYPSWDIDWNEANIALYCSVSQLHPSKTNQNISEISFLFYSPRLKWACGDVKGRRCKKLNRCLWKVLFYGSWHRWRALTLSQLIEAKKYCYTSIRMNASSWFWRRHLGEPHMWNKSWISTLVSLSLHFAMATLPNIILFFTNINNSTAIFPIHVDKDKGTEFLRAWWRGKEPTSLICK